jgi:hypothetical protein
MHGFGLSKKELRRFVGDIVVSRWNGEDETGAHLRRYCRFTNKIPGDEWLEKFMKDNKLSLVKPSPLERSRATAAADPFIVYEFYSLVEQELDRLNIKDKPDHIFNLDETAFFLDPSQVKVVAPTGKAGVHRVTSGPGRQAFSVMACISANGASQPPLVIFPAKHLYSTWYGKEALPGTTYACSEKGWMTADIFSSWFSTFVRTVTQRPLLLIFDGHKTHLSLEFISKARSENITVIKLPSHTSSRLQPLDVSCFHPVKYAWDEKLISHQRLSGFSSISKSDFVDILSKIWQEKFTSGNIQSGFRKTGIFPLDPDQFPRSSFHPGKLANYEAARHCLPAPLNVPAPSLTTLPNLFAPPSSAAAPSQSNEIVLLRESLARLTQQLQSFMGNVESTSSAAPSSSASGCISRGSPSVSELFFEKFAYKRGAQTETAEKRKRINQSSIVITQNEFFEATQEIHNRKNNPKKRRASIRSAIGDKCLPKLPRFQKGKGIRHSKPRKPSSSRSSSSRSDSDDDSLPKVPPPLSIRLKQRAENEQHLQLSKNVGAVTDVPTLVQSTPPVKNDQGKEYRREIKKPSRFIV